MCLKSVPAVTLSILIVSLLNACGIDTDRDEARPAGSDGWLTGTTHQKFDTLANQLGGFDQTMIEVGYRYTELYWSGQDENWEYARYQIEEMRSAMQDGFQRRPAREASAQPFMNVFLPQLEQAAINGDRALFDERFADITRNCNACHAMEEVPFIVVREPTRRHRPWGGENYVDPEE